VLGRRNTDYPLQVDRDLTEDHIDSLLEWQQGRDSGQKKPSRSNMRALCSTLLI